MSDPLVSVLVPVFNAAPYLETAVDSIRRQTYRNLEILLVDDGSSDASPEIMSRLACEDSRITCLFCEHRGLVPTLNEGLDRVSGDLVARMDADDICYPTRLERQVALHERNHRIALSGTHVDYLVAPDRRLRKRAVAWSSDDLKAYTVFDVFYVHSTVMLRRSILEEDQIRYSPDHFGAEDFFLFRRLIRDHEVAFLPDPLTAYRTNHPSVQSRHAQVCHHATHRTVVENFQDLAIDIDASRVCELFKPGRAFCTTDTPILRDYLNAGLQACALNATHPVASLAGYRVFVSGVFEALALRGNIRALANVYREERLGEYLGPRSRVLAALARATRDSTALALRGDLIRKSQLVRSARFEMP